MGPSAAKLANARQVDFSQVVQYPSDEEEDNLPKPTPSVARKEDPRYKSWYPNLAIQWPPGSIDMLKEEHLELWHSVCCRRQQNYLPSQSWHIYDEIVKHHKDEDLTYLETGIEKFRPPPKGASSQTTEGQQERGRTATAGNARKRSGSAQTARQKSQRRDRSKLSSKGQQEEYEDSGDHTQISRGGRTFPTKRGGRQTPGGQGRGQKPSFEDEEFRPGGPSRGGSNYRGGGRGLSQFPGRTPSPFGASTGRTTSPPVDDRPAAKEILGRSCRWFEPRPTHPNVRLARILPLPAMPWFTPDPEAPEIEDDYLHKEDWDLVNLTPKQRGHILMYPKDKTTWKPLGINLNQAPIRDMPYFLAQMMCEQEYDGHKNYLHLVTQLSAFVDNMPPSVQTRCRKNTLLLSTWSPGPQTTQCIDFFKRQGFTEHYTFTNGKHLFDYVSRRENFCYRNNYLMLKAYEGYWTTQDAKDSERNRQLRDDTIKQLGRGKPEETPQLSPDQFEQAAASVDFWGNYKPSAKKQDELDRQHQEALKRNLPAGSRQRPVHVQARQVPTARLRYDESGIEENEPGYMSPSEYAPPMPPPAAQQQHRKLGAIGHLPQYSPGTKFTHRPGLYGLSLAAKPTPQQAALAAHQAQAKALADELAENDRRRDELMQRQAKLAEAPPASSHTDGDDDAADDDDLERRRQPPRFPPRGGRGGGFGGFGGSYGGGAPPSY